MVIGRSDAIARAVDLVIAGRSVDVVGTRGSGRSTFMATLRKRLELDGWPVVSIRGVASLRQHPLAALHLSGVAPPSRPGSALPEAAAALMELTKDPKAVLFLDDWDDLDESSWGIAESIRRTNGVPIVLSRLQGLSARHTPSGLRASTLEPSYVIDMTPLGFDDLEKVLVEFLGGPIEASTMSRIFAKSGGNVGLAVNLADATSREGLLKQREDTQEWAAKRDLWSPGLRAVLEGHLEDLEPAARDALEIIALVGVAGTESVRKLVDWETLELLEERSLITFVPGDPQKLITVVPPLLVEFFRHEPLTARRTRLTELIIERLGSTESATSVAAEYDLHSDFIPENEAVFVRLLHERARARRIVTASEWETLRSPANSIRYVNALIHTNTPAASSTINRVYALTDATSAGSAERADFVASHARWLAYGEGNLSAALTLLRESKGESLGVFGRILDAAEVEILVNVETLPEHFEERLEITDELPPRVQSALLEAQLLVTVAAARFKDARRIFALLEGPGMTPPSHMAKVLHALALLGQGRYKKALDLLLQGMDEAHGYLDIEGVRLFGAAASLCYIHSGDYSKMDDLLETVFSTGEPTPIPAGTQLSLLAVSSLVAARRGRIVTSERLAAEVDRLNIPDGPLPGEAKAWAHIQLLVFNGESAKAADLLWDSSVDLWNRGARFAALVGLLATVEISAEDSRIEAVRSMLTEVPEAVSYRAHLAYVDALKAKDIPQILVAAGQLEKVGRIGLALSACWNAENMAIRSDDGKGREGALALERQLRERHPEGDYDVLRFTTTSVVLSEREIEVAQLAAEGHSNKEIATRLVLSVRTVESHIHRILRKIDAPNRGALRARIEFLNTDPSEESS